jgi:hypothetical protein
MRILDEYNRVRDARRDVAELLARLRRNPRGQHPARKDVSMALRPIPGEPWPAEIIEYVRRTYVDETARRPGPTASRSMKTRDMLMHLYYQSRCRELRSSEESKEVSGMAARETADVYKVSPKTVQRIIRAASRTKRET